MCDREMNLKEWVERLHKSHLARREYDALMKLQPLSMSEADKAMQDSIGAEPWSEEQTLRAMDIIMGKRRSHLQIMRAVCEAADTLTKKLQSIHDDPKYMAVWHLFASHGFTYDGPTFTNELESLEKELAALHDDME